jgi:glycosyltransferase involved in cell wall biosynthesis
MPPLVSVVVPCFNAAAYIGECLYSLTMSSYPNLEVIVVDDGSTDSTAEIISQFSGVMKYIKLDTNRGLASALNVGLSAADGDYIARLDADDIAEPWRFTKQVTFMLANPSIDVAGCGADVFGAAHTIYRSPETHEDIVNAFLVGNPFVHPTIILRRRILRENLFRYDETAANEEDYELWARLIVKGSRLANEAYSGVKCRIHDANVSHSHPAKRAIKKRALTTFCQHFGISKEIQIDALIDFQCSGFISRENFNSLRSYAIKAEQRGWPKLGWLQNSLISHAHYREFSGWYWRKKGRVSII